MEHRTSSHIHDAQDDDVWCIDTRGVLTLCVCKETYERLGLVGQKLSFKHQSGERYGTETKRSRIMGCKLYPERRCSWYKESRPEHNTARKRNVGDPNLLPCPTDSLDRWSTQAQIVNPTIHNVTCEISHLENVWVPDPASLPPRPQPEQEEDQEDWDHEVSTLFEWIGMAGLHAQRLQANDRVDPFVAMYEPPTTSRVGNVTHFRWRGLLSPSFVQAVVDTSVTLLKSSQTPTKTFVAITAHGITNSPVVYLPQPRTETSKGKLTAAAPSPPSHLPRKDGEDTWCLVLAPPKEGRNDVKSILYESVGQWDTRWG
ncbi:hypothetical protein AN958_12821 [Leucoagaricus sp. SymC.cos]|nr:hypothetical protein AN958_12821 [Leucoagaricus sp. SymC.cos]